MRTLVTTYYGPGKNKPVLKTNRSSVRSEALPNAVRHMTANSYGAVVATVHDSETAELLLVVTYAIGAKLQVVFENDVKQPICITEIE